MIKKTKRSMRCPNIFRVSYLPHILVVIFFLICFVKFRSDFEKIDFDVLPQAYSGYLFVALLVMTSYLIRALRWRSYLKYLGYEIPMVFAVLTYLAGFAYTLAPGKVGEMMRATYYQRYKIPVTVVAAAFSVEKISDLGVFVSLALIFLGYGTQEYGALMTIVGICIPVLLLIMGLKERHVEAVTQRAMFKVGKLGFFIQGLLTTIVAAKRLLTIRALVFGLSFGFAAWSLECLSLYALGFITQIPSISVGDTIGIYAAAIVIGAVTFLPGGLGTTEAAMAALLVRYGHDLSSALLITIVCRLLTLWLAVALGWISVGLLRIYRWNVPT